MIPPRYVRGMSHQLTVRLADASVQHVDQLVADGAFPSRAQYLDYLVRRDVMLRRSLADLEKLAEFAEDGEPYPEFVGLGSWASAPIDLA